MLTESMEITWIRYTHMSFLIKLFDPGHEYLHEANVKYPNKEKMDDPVMYIDVIYLPKKKFPQKLSLNFVSVLGS